MKKTIISIITAIAIVPATSAQTGDYNSATSVPDIEYEAGALINAGTQDFAPYHISSNRAGTVTQEYSTLLHAGIRHSLDTTKRLSWAAGAQVWTGWTSDVNSHFPKGKGEIETVAQHPSRAWIQELYATGKYRGVFITLGQKEHGSPLLNDALSSGDLVMSRNARPGYGINAGFVNFQNIPFTRGWVQIRGELGYYRLRDGNWLKNHFNPRNSFINTGYWLNYKNIHFRTKPSERFVFTIGLQAACQFGGTYNLYDNNGELVQTIKMDDNAKAFFKALIPGSGGSNVADEHYYEGNHLGSWDVMLEYKLPRGATIKAYYQSPWEDGSGIGKKNGFDGLWGLEYNAGKKAPISGAVIEFLEMTNHSGPLHFNPHDYRDADRPDGSPIAYQATGADDYYNNYAYNGYQNRGLAIGSSMLKGPLYNTDGYLRFLDNVLRGFHLALEGDITRNLSYRAKYTWRKSWGNIFMPRLKPVTCSSATIQGVYNVPSVNGLSITLQLALDHGNFYNWSFTDFKKSTNFGALIDITYRGDLSFSPKH